MNKIKDYLQYRKRFYAIPGFREYYRNENNRRALSRVRVLMWLGIVLFAACFILDYLLYPDQAAFFLGLRALFAGITVICLMISRSEWGQRHILTIVFFNALLGDWSISLMSSQIGGWTSLYFVGNITVMMGVTMFIPWRPRVTLMYCLAVLFGYVAINGLFHPFTLPMIIPVTFICVVMALAYFSSMSNEVGRMTELSWRLEIEKAHESLKTQNDIIKKQLDQAKQIQRTLLPPMQQSLNGINVGAIYEPSEELSGDFFDTLTVNGYVYVYLADVTGHGLPAAQVTYLVKSIFQTALNRDMELSELFDLVREQYVAHGLKYDLGLQLARFNTKTRVMEFIRSNAPDPIMVDAKGEGTILEFPVSPLISAVNYDRTKKANVGQVTLDPDSFVYIYSDGAFEFVQKTGNAFGQRRLLKAVANSHNEKWPESLTQSLQAENAEDYFPDDLTILRMSFSS
ncbi:hypothetical protein AZI86_00240 [Bdellovibrio bacteriovorus]|uniref:PPM-type phosphatase domain-containing protein n=1 Tax=Bdellovibrio bacteriovorus TaxID=959 RepID=A0A150WME4_BDEBC|nr:SpoIIE family protein phosphatase [Bdellovibrio bacteriovorus]KYG65544.1 hypothetical protein AZI86_00240 [Bdellovibrio bacteriovorus]